MNYNEKIIGFYGFDDLDKDGNSIKKYCAVGKDKETGKLSYYFTDTKEEAAKYLSRYCKDNDYNKSNKNRIFTDNLDKANINCKTLSDVYNRIQKANSKEKLDGNEFLDTYGRKYNSEEKKDNVFSRIVSYFSKHKKVRNITIAAAALATLIASGVTLKLVKGPDNVVNNETAMDDSVDKNKADDADADDADKTKDDEKEKSEETKEEESKEEADTVTTVASTSTPANSYNEPTNYSSSSTSTHNSSSSNTTKKPGSINESVPEYQEPTSIDNSNNNSDNTNNNSTDIYEDVTEEETPVVEEENTPNKVEEDYSQELEVPAVTDDEPTDVKDEPEENESSEDLNKEDVDLKDELVGNIDAIDDDVSYDLVYETDGTSDDYEVEYAPTDELPDPNFTADNSDDYVTTEEDLQQMQNIDNTTTNDAASIDNSQQVIDVVPVYQEDTTISNEQAVDQAIAAMENGEDVNLVYDADTNTLSTEPSVSADVETNSMTK